MPATEIAVPDEELPVRQRIVGKIDLVEKARADLEALDAGRGDERTSTSRHGRYGRKGGSGGEDRIPPLDAGNTSNSEGPEIDLAFACDLVHMNAAENIPVRVRCVETEEASCGIAREEVRADGAHSAVVVAAADSVELTTELSAKWKRKRSAGPIERSIDVAAAERNELGVWTINGWSVQIIDRGRCLVDGRRDRVKVGRLHGHGGKKNSPDDA